MTDFSDYYNLSDLKDLKEIDEDRIKLRRALQDLNKRKRAIRQRAYMRSISKRDSANAATGARV